jgi:hypothetical protein
MFHIMGKALRQNAKLLGSFYHCRGRVVNEREKRKEGEKKPNGTRRSLIIDPLRLELGFPGPQAACMVSI